MNGDGRDVDGDVDPGLRQPQSAQRICNNVTEKET